MDNLIASIIQSTNLAVERAVKQAIQATKSDVLDQKKKQFDEHGANDWDSEPFPELKESTKKRKKSYPYPDKPLYRSGNLKNSLRESTDPDSLGVETDVSYAEYAGAWVKAGGSQHTFDELSEKEMERAMEVLIENTRKEMQNGLT